MSYLKMALRALESATEREDQECRSAGISELVSSYLPIEKPAKPTERVLSCFECFHFRLAVNSPNPTQAWGHCRKQNKGRYGVATACEAILNTNGGNHGRDN